MSGGTYLQPASVDEALALLAEHDGAALVAGGTDLVVGTRQGKRTLPETLVAIHRLPDLDGIGEEGGALVLGALATHDAIERSDLVRSRWTALADASAIVGSPATRHVGTHRRQPRERLAGHGDRRAVRRVRRRGGAALVGRLALRGGRELLVGPRPYDGGARRDDHRRPRPRPGRRLGERVRPPRVPAVDGDRGRGSGGTRDACGRRNGGRRAGRPDRGRPDDRPLAGRGGGAAGKRPTDEAIAAAAAAVHDTAAPISDVRGSDGYRKAMIEVIARRAIDVAARRAAGEHVPVPATMTVGGTR